MNKRGRPPGSTKPDSMYNKIIFRVSDDDLEKIKQFAGDADLPMAEYCRKRSLKQNIRKENP